MKTIGIKYFLLVFYILIAIGLNSCAKPPIRLSFGLSEPPSRTSAPIPLRVGVVKFKEEKEFSLDLDNLTVDVIPEESISSGFTDAFIDYLHQANIFKSILKEPFKNDDVDLVLKSKIVNLQTDEPEFASAMAGAFFRGLTIIGQLVPQYQKVITTVEVELNVNSVDGEKIKTYGEKTSVTKELQSLGPGMTASFEKFMKRPGLMEAMTKTFRKISDNLVRDKDEILSKSSKKPVM
jgi:hypothetical protein